MIVLAWKIFHALFMRMNPAVGRPVKRLGRVDRVVYIFVSMSMVSIGVSSIGCGRLLSARSMSVDVRTIRENSTHWLWELAGY
jgi:hypothetical protein